MEEIKKNVLVIAKAMDEEMGAESYVAITAKGNGNLYRVELNNEKCHSMIFISDLVRLKERLMNENIWASTIEWNNNRIVVEFVILH